MSDRWKRISDPIVFLGGPVGPTCFDCGSEMGQALFSPLYVAYDPAAPEDGAELVCGDCIAEGKEAPDARA